MFTLKRGSAILLLGLFAWLGGAVSFAQNVLILTDASGPSNAGDAHIADLREAFDGVATITFNDEELTNTTTMLPSLVAGWDVVIVVTVGGNAIDPADVPVLQAAVNQRASRAFMFFTDGCVGCTTASVEAALQIVNTIGGWSASLGGPFNGAYQANLNGDWLFSALFGGLDPLFAGAYRRLINVPASNVMYSSEGTGSDGPMAVAVGATGQAACVFMATDVSEFYAFDNVPQGQVDALAAAYINAAVLPDGPCEPPVGVPAMQPLAALLTAALLLAGITLVVVRRRLP